MYRKIRTAINHHKLKKQRTTKRAALVKIKLLEEKTMKKLNTYTLLLLSTLFLGTLSQRSLAQESELLITHELEAFEKLNVTLKNTEVIIIISSRNQVIVQGDSLTQEQFSYNQDNGELVLSSNTNLAPTRIVIETEALTSLTTNDTGKIYLIGKERQKLGIANSTLLTLNNPNNED